MVWRESGPFLHKIGAKAHTLQTDFTDQEIGEMLGAGNEKAIDVLFNLHYAYLCQSAFRLLGQQSIAEDIVQEVFYELWKRRYNLNIKSSFRAYLKKATINKSLNYLRDHKYLNENLELQDWLPSKQRISEQIEANELRQLIDKTIDQLPNRCRIIFILNRFENLSYKDIGEQLGISIKTVENQISKALKILRETLGPFLGMFIGMSVPFL